MLVTPHVYYKVSIRNPPANSDDRKLYAAAHIPSTTTHPSLTLVNHHLCQQSCNGTETPLLTDLYFPAEAI